MIQDLFLNTIKSCKFSVINWQALRRLETIIIYLDISNNFIKIPPHLRIENYLQKSNIKNPKDIAYNINHTDNNNIYYNYISY